MSGLPALPLWIDAWVADTAHLSRAERGLYHDLLVLMWKTPGCRVPNDLAWIGRKLRCDEAEMELLAGIISEFCQTCGNWITQKRLAREFEYVCERSGKNKKAAEARWEKERLRLGKVEVKKTSDTSKALKNNESTICERNAPTPTPTPILNSASKDAFESADAALRKVVGIDGHPVAVDPVIAPIWQLIQQGFDLHREIIPSIQRQLAKRGNRRVSRWSFFVPGIVDDRAGAIPASQSTALAEWEKKLDWARRERRWPYSAWGPPPHKPGCRVPVSILRADDGEGWGDWRVAS